MEKALNENSKSKDTKEKIIEAAIDEFASKGYDDASMRKIAEIVGIKASSIYNHFKSKEDILEEIFKYYRNAFYQDQVIFKIDGVYIKEDTIPNILKQGFRSVVDILKKPKMTNILKIMVKEQFKNQKIREFFLEEFIQNPREVMEQFMTELIKKGVIKDGKPYLLSQEFNAFSIYKMYEEFMLKNMDYIDIDGFQEEVNEHIDFFWNSIKNNGFGGLENG